MKLLPALVNILQAGDDKIPGEKAKMGHLVSLDDTMTPPTWPTGAPHKLPAPARVATGSAAHSADAPPPGRRNSPEGPGGNNGRGSHVRGEGLRRGSTSPTDGAPEKKLLRLAVRTSRDRPRGEVPARQSRRRAGSRRRRRTDPPRSAGPGWGWGWAGPGPEDAGGGCGSAPDPRSPTPAPIPGPHPCSPGGRRDGSGALGPLLTASG